ncbi:MAG: hypothetical protein U1E27_00150 [Kiritimatiellia bacterium]|nr:hypothetical protein [Kiritimatiellia bacterium]
MRLDLRRMPWSELASLLRDVAKEIEQRGHRTANPQYREDRGAHSGYGGGGNAYGSSPGYGGVPGPRGAGGPGPRGKKRFGRPPYRPSVHPQHAPQSAPELPPRDEEFNR